MCVCVCVCVCVCARARARACVRACVRYRAGGMLLVVEITHFVYYISCVGAMYRGLLESPILLSYPLTEQQGRQESRS